MVDPGREARGQYKFGPTHGSRRTVRFVNWTRKPGQDVLLASYTNIWVTRGYDSTDCTNDWVTSHIFVSIDCGFNWVQYCCLHYMRLCESRFHRFHLFTLHESMWISLSSLSFVYITWDYVNLAFIAFIVYITWGSVNLAFIVYITWDYVNLAFISWDYVNLTFISEYMNHICYFSLVNVCVK
jgi:hypothetical protein